MAKGDPVCAQLATAFGLLSFLTLSLARPSPDQQIAKPLYSGYIPLSSKPGSSLYYAYYEASNAEIPAAERPILLWLQGGPGCASTFGAFYELGPTVVDSTKPKPKPSANPWALNRLHGLLVVDQPIGTGYSIAGSEDDIPFDMEGMAADLYEGLWGFFNAHQDLQQRPFFIAGESYGGKYVPSITHYILQAESWGSTNNHHHHQQQQQQVPCKDELHIGSSSRKGQSPPQLLLPLLRRKQLQGYGAASDSSSINRCRHQLKHPRALASNAQAPNFNLTGIAIGNGLTDPVSQTRALAGVIFNMGMVTEATRQHMQDQAEIVIQLVQEQQWPQAVQQRQRLIDYIANTSGVATLLDIRRTEGYDAGEAVQQLLDSSEVKAIMGADPGVSYASCSQLVERVMGPDTMKSARALVEDILDVLPVLLYQGQFDGQDGVASNNAWISNLDWEYSRDFSRLEGQLWLVDGLPAGWQRNVSTLTQAMVRNAGHMVPRDQPKAMQQLMEGWVGGVLQQMSDAAAAAVAAGMAVKGEARSSLPFSIIGSSDGLAAAL